MNQEPDEESFPRNIGLGIYWRLGHPPSDFAEAVPDAAPGKTFAGIGENDCRWAIGEDADGTHRFCGCPRHRPSFYCASHLAVSAAPEEPAPVRSLAQQLNDLRLRRQAPLRGGMARKRFEHLEAA